MRQILIVLQAALLVCLATAPFSWANADVGSQQEQAKSVFARRINQLEKSIECSIELMTKHSAGSSELERSASGGAIADIVAELSELGAMEAKLEGQFLPGEIKTARLRSLRETAEQVCDEQDLQMLCEAINREITRIASLA